MSWETLNLSEIPLEETAKPAPIPAGTYTLQLMTAEPSKFRTGGINITTSVVDEGPYMGRRVFIDVPPIEEQAWAAQIVARLFKALGVTPTPYSDPTVDLNRVAMNGHSRFIADVSIRNFTRNDGSAGSANKVNHNSFRPAA
jgi:hypothetical protein